MHLKQVWPLEHTPFLVIRDSRPYKLCRLMIGGERYPKRVLINTPHIPLFRFFRPIWYPINASRALTSKKLPLSRVLWWSVCTVYSNIFDWLSIDFYPHYQVTTFLNLPQFFLLFPIPSQQLIPIDDQFYWTTDWSVEWLIDRLIVIFSRSSIVLFSHPKFYAINL